MTYEDSELDSFLDFLVLTDTYHNKLDAPIAVKEVQKALGMLQLGKIPGPDGIPIEFFQTYADYLISHTHSILVGSLAASLLPDERGSDSCDP